MSRVVSGSSVPRQRELRHEGGGKRTGLVVQMKFRGCDRMAACIFCFCVMQSGQSSPI